MKTFLLFVMVLALLVMPCIAGEYQKESIEYERAFASGKYAAAAELAQTGVGKGNALNAQGLAAYRAGKLASAKELLEEAIQNDPEQYWAYNNLGCTLVALGDLDGAVEQFKKAIEVNSADKWDGAAEQIKKATTNLETTMKLIANK